MACCSLLLFIITGVLSSPSVTVEKTVSVASEDLTANSTSQHLDASDDPQEALFLDHHPSAVEAAALDVAVPVAKRVLTALSSAINGVMMGTAGRRKDSPWDSAAPALMIGGTVAALLLAAVGALAGKALLASILAATISAMQLARPPPGGPAG